MGNQKLSKILSEFQSEWSKKKDYPYLYCNVASKALLNILSDNGIEAEPVFSYIEEGDGHMFLKTKGGTIIDPTYGQYDEDYKYIGYIGEEFPIPELNNNTMSACRFQELQKRRFKDGKLKIN